MMNPEIKLSEYLHMKEELLKLRTLPNCVRTEKDKNRIDFLIKEISTYLSSLDKETLQKIILLSLNIESKYKIGKTLSNDSMYFIDKEFVSEDAAKDYGKTHKLFPEYMIYPITDIIGESNYN